MFEQAEASLKSYSNFFITLPVSFSGSYIFGRKVYAIS